MSLYLKRLVSGKKARYRDDQLDLELDLAYVTDQIIVMGFPAVGVEGIYRNRRADVQRFLSARHGSNFWVFNLCPVRENAYDDNVFGGRVSRYPFPDHHVPPFLYLPLATREIHAWLSGSDTRVAVLHCKAGKGRSGTLACAYLLSRHAPPSAPMPSSHSFGDWLLIGEKQGFQTPSPETSTVLPAKSDDDSSVRPASIPSSAVLSPVSSGPTNTLEMILQLHTSRRMQPSRYHPDALKKSKTGVSIPSQRRWLSYWSQVLAGKGPPSLRPFRAEDHPEHQQDPLERTKVKLTRLTIRMHEPSGIQSRLVQAASMVVTKAGKGRATSESTTGKLWACLARYSDHLVDELERWEKESCSLSGEMQASPFKSDQWDETRMIHSFAQMGISDILPVQQAQSERSILTYILCPLVGTDEDQVKPRGPLHKSSHESQHQYTSGSESSSFALVPPSVIDDDAEDSSGIILEADRELRIKLFMGEVVLGWVWIIPAFHISPVAPSSSLVLPSDDIDFTIGIGKALVDMRVSFTCQPCNQGS